MNTVDRFKQVEALYHEARERPAAERSAFLDEACAHDEALRHEVESLFAHESDGDTFFEAFVPAVDGPRVALGDVLGPYIVVEFLGAGGMGEVYKARDPRLERDVAIKVLAATAPLGLDRRLLAEAQLAGGLNHPNILTVYDVGSHEGSPFLVTELLRGETLRQRLAGGSLSSDDAIDVGRQIAQGLAAAHDQGIVHRDLKPENVFVTTEGRVKILDFGIARRTALAPSDSDAPGGSGSSREGTAGYMAPEQLRGGPVDHRADLYGWGAMLHELLTGQRPAQPLVTDAVRPPALASIVSRCLQQNPDDRFADARALMGALDSAARPRGSRRRHLAFAAVAVAALVGAGVLGRAWWMSAHEAALVATAPAVTATGAANEAYLRGRFFLAKGTEEDIRKSIAYFEESAAADPKLALPFAGIADAYTALRSVYAAPSDVMPQARAAAAEAIARDPSLAEAHVAMGGVLMYYDFDWAGAERELTRAIALRPDLAAAHETYALLLAAQGRAAEARAAIERARALDPLSLPILVDAGWVAYLARDFSRTVALNQKAVQLDEAFWPSFRDLGLGYEKLGRFDDAVAMLRKARSLDGNSTVLEMLAGSYAAAGRISDAKTVLADLDGLARRQYVCPYEIATVHACLRDPSAALDALEQGYAQRADCMPWAATDPKLDALRGLPRFQALMRRMGLPAGG